MKFIIVLFLSFALVHGGLVAKKVSKEKTTEKTALVENANLSDESADLTAVDEIVTESSTNKNDDETHTEVPSQNKDDKVKKSEKLTKTQTEKPDKVTEKPVQVTEKAVKDDLDSEKTHKHDVKQVKKLANELDEQLKKIKEESQTTQKPTLPSTAAPKTTTKSSKNSASKDRSCYVLLTSILIILLTASL